MNFHTKNLFTFLLFYIFFISFQVVNAQNEGDIFKLQDLSQVKVEQLSNDQINKIKSGLQQKNVTIDQMQSVAIAKGMSASQFSLLKNRLQEQTPIQTNETGSSIESIPTNFSIDPEETKNNPKKIESKIFGADIFSNPSLSFEPNSNMATPVNYILGTGDELQIVVYGIQEFSTVSTVSKEGKISVPNVGQINVGGMTLEAAISLIKSSCGKVFSTLKSGQSNISVSLTKIRTIKVTIIGSEKAGNYSLSSLSTVFNALYVAGGPNENGSYRNIELLRGNKIIRKIDIYKFLLNGDQSDNIGLKDNDIIRIPTYTCRVSIEGEVKNSGIFELNPTENFHDLLKYCSGFSESAYLSTIKLIQNTDKELKIIDLTKNEYEAYKPKSGDVFKVGRILNRFENRISIKGSVFRPDYYSFSPEMRVLDLINKADGLTEDAFKGNAQITRLKDDFSKEIISVNITKVLERDSSNNIQLKKEDELIIYSLFDFKEVQNIRIEGQVRNPGIYPYLENLTLYDVILQAGGFSDNASKKIEVSRIIKKDEIIKNHTEIATIIELNGNDIISDKTKNFMLSPSDFIFVRKMPIYETGKTIKVTGFVEYPGIYSIANDKETILEIINRSGGLKSTADEKAIYINRGDYKIPINFKKISRNPKSLQNITLQSGDELVVLKYSPSVKIVGNVALNTEIPFIKGKNLKHYVYDAGGFNDRSLKRKITIFYPNGTAGRTRNFLLLKIYPKVLAGSIINVPVKPVREKRSLQEIVSVASVSVSIATMVTVLINVLNQQNQTSK